MHAAYYRFFAFLLLPLCAAGALQAQENNTTDVGAAYEQSVGPLLPDKFCHRALSLGLQQYSLAQVAREKVTEPQTRILVTALLIDYPTLNRRLLDLIKVRGFTIPSTNAVDAPRISRPLDPQSKVTSDKTNNDKPTSSDQVSNEASEKDQTIEKPRDNGQEQLIKQLKLLPSADFERVYVALVISDHEKLVLLMKKALAEEEDQEINKLASEALPNLERFLKAANEILILRETNKPRN